MPVFWITINPADLWYLLVIRLAEVEIILGEETQSVFARTTAIINLIAVAKFFHLTCKTLFVSLLAVSKPEGGLLIPILGCFATIETNRRGMLHLYCLFWLRKVTYLATIRFQIQDNHEFLQKLLAFLEHVIKYSISSYPHPKTLHQICPDANSPMTASKCATLFKEDSKSVARKVQMHSPSHNPTCFKYNTCKTRVCRFDFPRPI